MKNSIKLLLLITLCFSSMFSKAQNFLYPISEIEFQQQYQGTASRGSDEGKYRGFKMNSNGKYFSSQQVKQLALLFSGDYWRYQFAVAAYPQTADQQNFYDVYDAFTTYSAIFRLNDFLKSLPDQVYGNAQPTQPIPTRPTVPLPDCNGYNGKSNCSLPLTDNDFDYYSRNIFYLNTDDAKMRAASDLISRSCISMGQLMRIVLSFSLETNRLKFMKNHFALIYDMENYNYATAVFSNPMYKNDWINYARSVLAPPRPMPVPVPMPTPLPPQVPVCGVRQDEMPELLNTIKKQNFSETMVALAHQIIVAKKCFTTNQIIQIIGVFPFAENKMDIAKFSWDYCTDKNNYYTLVDAFNFSGDKEELMKFINLKK